MLYGDCIVFEHMKFKGDSVKAGLLGGTGFVDKGLYLYQYKDYTTVLESEALRPVNYRDAAFKITPKLHYDHHSDFNKTRKKYHELINKNKKESKDEDAADFYQKKLTKLVKKMEDEKCLNDKIIAGSQRKPVIFGDEVQMMHLESQFFLSSKNNYDDNDVIGFNCEMSLRYKEAMVFKILPKLRSHKLGDCIPHQSAVMLYNIKFDAYLEIKEEELESRYFHSPFTSKLPQHNFFDPDYQIYRAMFKTSPSTYFRISHFKGAAELERSVLTFDYVTLTHTEMKASLSADRNYKMNNVSREFAYLRQYKGEEPAETFSLDSVWLIEPIDSSKQSVSVQLPENVKDFNQIPRYTLRHFTTGKLFGFFELNGERALIVDKEPFNRHVYFVPIQKSKTMFNKSMCCIHFSADSKFLCADDNSRIKLDGNDADSYTQEKSEVFKYLPLTDKDASIKKLGLKIEEAFPKQNLFKIEKLDSDHLQKVLFLKSATTAVRLFYEKFKNKDSVKDMDIQKTRDVIKKIICFIFSINKRDVSDFNEVGGNPLKEHQKLCRDFLVLDLLIEIIYIAFTTYGVQKVNPEERLNKQIGSSSIILEFVRLCFSALRYIILEYRPNELYTSQWLNFLMNETLKSSKERDTYIGRTLTELIDNNKRIIETRIKKETILKIISDMSFNIKNPCFIDLLRAICICDGEPMIVNQNIMTSYLLSSDKFREAGFKFYQSDDKIFIVNSKFGFEEPLLKLESIEGQPSYETYQYVIKLCDLFSDLSKNRNYRAITFLQEKFNKKILIGIIKSDSYNFELRATLLNLFEYIWLDIEPYRVTEFPSLILSHNTEHKEFKKVEFDSSFKELYLFFETFLSGYKHSAPSSTSELIFAIKIIEVLTKMVKISFFNGPETYRRLIKVLLEMLMDKDGDNTSQIFRNNNLNDNPLVLLKNSDDINSTEAISSFKNLYLTVFELISFILQFALEDNYSLFTTLYKKLGKKEISLTEFQSDTQSRHSISFQSKFLEFYRHEFIIKQRLEVLSSQDKLQLNLTLMKICCHVNDERIFASAINLLNLIFNRHSEFIKNFNRAAIIDNQVDLDVLNRLKAQAVALSEKTANLDEWYVPENFEAILKSIKDLNVFKQQKKNLNPSDGLSHDILISLEHRLLSGIQADFRVTQNIIYNLDLIPYLFKILKHDELLGEKYRPANTQIVNHIYELLVYCERNNLSICKIILSNYIDTITYHTSQGNSYALMLLTEIYRDSQNIVISSSTTKNIETVLGNIQIDSLNNLDFFCQYLVFLQVLVSYKGYNLKNNQNHVFYTVVADPKIVS